LLHGILNEAYFDIAYTVHLWSIKILLVEILTAYLHNTQLEKPGYPSLSGTYLFARMVRAAAPSQHLRFSVTGDTLSTIGWKYYQENF
jgi:hypothetical protein